MKISLCSIRFREQPIEEIVERIAQLGYDGTEIVIDHVEGYLKRKGELVSLRDFVHSQGLEIPIIASAFNFTGTEKVLKESIDKAYRCIGYAQTLGVPLIRIGVEGRYREIVGKFGACRSCETQGGIGAAALLEDVKRS